MHLSDKVALVTGASRGLGYELASLLAERGTRLAIVARAAEALQEAAEKLRRKTQVVAVVADVSEDAEKIAAAAIARFGRVDILFNNASELGPSPMPALDALPWQAMERILRVNVTAPLHLTQLLLPGMRALNAGAIVNITSDAGMNAYATWGGYGASKAALEHMSRVLAAELEPSALRVLVVDPGDMNTQMHREAEPGVDISALPHPRSVAPHIIALLDDDAPSGRYEAQKLARALVAAAQTATAH